MAVISREGQAFQAEQKLWRDLRATATTANVTDADPKQPRRSAGRRTTDDEGQHASGGSAGGDGTGGDSGGSSGGGGFTEWRQKNRGWAFILGVACMLLIIIILFLINDYFTEKQVTRLERLSRIPSVPIAAQAAQPSSPVSPPEVTSAEPRQTREQYVSANKRAMIGRCGRNVQELVYKPSAGCFYFDNLSGSSEKTVGLWSRTVVDRIVGEFDDKPNIVITGPDGSSCESSAADHCESWVQQFAAGSEGFRKFTIRVPQGQGFLAHLDIN